MRAFTVAVLLLFGACGGDDGPSGNEFLSGWPELPDGPEIEGHPTKVDEEEQVLYVDDCDVAERATSSGEFDGFAYICP